MSGLTPILEKAVLQGRASFKTYGIGGMGKNILPCPDDRFIVITNIIDYPHFPDPIANLTAGPEELLKRSVYQININTESRQYHFPIRKSFSMDNNGIGGFGPPVNIETYLVCQSAIEIVYLSPGDKGLQSTLQGLTASETGAGVRPAVGLGREGLQSSLQSDLIMKQTYSNSFFQTQSKEQNALIGQGLRAFNEYRLGIDDQSRYMQNSGSLNEKLEENYQHPLGIIQYCEVFGLPTDLQ